MKKNLIVGALVACVLTAAALGTRGVVQKNLEYEDIKITLNGKEITPMDANGNYVEPFTIDGTTYLPVRAVAGALGLDVDWDDANKTVILTDSAASSKDAEYTSFLEGIQYPKYQLTSEAQPEFVGRWFEKEIEGVKHMVTLSDGSCMYFLTDGASGFDVNFTVITTGKTPYFAYSIDGAQPVRQLITSPHVDLPDTGLHTVRVWADGMTEGEGKWQQEKGFALKNVTVDAGVLRGIKPTNKLIAYYGDSITEGIRALNMNADSDGNSATNAYPYFCSTALGATTYSIGYGATGVLAVGSFNTFLNTIDNISVFTPENDIHPDVIVINHGTNDRSYAVNIFKNKLVESLDHLLEKYPDTPVFYLIPFSQAMSDPIHEVLANYSDKITIIETEGWNITYVDGYHPDAAGAKVAGENLAQALKDALGEQFWA